MKQKINLIITLIVIPFIIGLVVNFAYDKIKNHSNDRKSDFEFEFNLNIRFK